MDKYGIASIEDANDFAKVVTAIQNENYYEEKININHPLVTVKVYETETLQKAEELHKMIVGDCYIVETHKF